VGDQSPEERKIKKKKGNLKENPPCNEWELQSTTPLMGKSKRK
jgi:uncharacterized protein YneF (UPF0154 family)